MTKKTKKAIELIENCLNTLKELEEEDGNLESQIEELKKINLLIYEDIKKIKDAII